MHFCIQLMYVYIYTLCWGKKSIFGLNLVMCVTFCSLDYDIIRLTKVLSLLHVCYIMTRQLNSGPPTPTSNALVIILEVCNWSFTSYSREKLNMRFLICAFFLDLFFPLVNNYRIIFYGWLSLLLARVYGYY